MKTSNKQQATSNKQQATSIKVILCFLLVSVLADINYAQTLSGTPSWSILPSSNFNNNDCQTVGVNGCYPLASPLGKVAMFNIVSNTTPSNPYFRIDRFKYYVDPVSGMVYHGQLVYDKTHFVISEDGYVGIGLQNPLYNMHVNGSAYFNSFERDMNINTNEDAVLSFNNTDNASQYIQFQRSGTRFFWLGLDNTNTFNVGADLGGLIRLRSSTQIDNDLVVQGNLTIQGNNSSATGNKQIKLYSNGVIRAREIQVDLNIIPDYVFAKDYNLMPIQELRRYVELNKHLPNIKGEAEFQEDGSISIGELNLKLLEKIEELTLYILQQQEQIDNLQMRIDNLNN